MPPAPPSPDAFLTSSAKRLTFVGMSGVGKTTLAQKLRATEEWFHYSVDYRIGTRYLGEEIVDVVKREAMKTPFLRDLLMSDSIYIGSNITFENLAPLSAYLGKPGAVEKGGQPFREYLRRQRLHRAAEIAAMADVGAFAGKARDIYGYNHFLCDASGSVVEVVDPWDPDDPVLRALAQETLIVAITNEEQDREELVRRFSTDPKPMYYDEAFLHQIWAEYQAEAGETPETADPDAFIRWGYRRLLDRRTPRYQAIGDLWGVSVTARDLAAARSPDDILNVIAEALASEHGA
ncbi:MAG: ATPase [Rhodobacteraceae bacterium]|nr:ATPase [Paracoccaceae bacterium]